MGTPREQEQSEMDQKQKDDLQWVEGLNRHRRQEAQRAKDIIDKAVENGIKCRIQINREGIIGTMTDPNDREFLIPEGPPKVIHPPEDS